MKTRLKRDRSLPQNMVSSDVTDYMEFGERVLVDKNTIFDLVKIENGEATLSNDYFMIFVPEKWIKLLDNK